MELLDAWIGGDRAAGDELLVRHVDAVGRFFRSKLGDDVDELVQRCFLACIEHRDRFLKASSFRAYLFGIARNILLMHLRQLNHTSHDELSSRSMVDLDPSPSSRMRRLGVADRVSDALDRLPLDQRIAVELSYWEGLSAPEVAVVLDVNSNTVRSRLSRARATLRSALGSDDPGL